MTGFLVVPVNRKHLNVISTDTCIYYCFRFSFVCYFENETTRINFISEREF